MTDGERAVWVAVYATSWHHPTCDGPGSVLDETKARYAVGQAERAVRALQEFAHRCASEHAIEVLK